MCLLDGLFFEMPVPRKTAYLLSIVPLLLCSCLRLQQEITIEDENQGRFKIQISVPRKTYQQFIQNRDDGVARFFDPDAGSAYFPAEQGFRIDNYRVFEHENRQYIQMAGRLTDVEKALSSDKLGAFKLTQAAENAKLSLVWKDLPPDDAPSIAPAVAGLKLFLKINLPGSVIDSTAHKQGPRSVSWIFNADQDAGFVSAPPKIEVSYEK